MPRQIFFDLDHTLWDFDLNSKEALIEILKEFEPRMGLKVDFEEFFPHFRYIHKHLWKLYQQNEIESKEIRYRRFRFAFAEMDIEHESWVEDFGHAYIEQCPLKPHLVEGARETLDLLHQHFKLHIITNGFAKTQNIKMESSDLKKYFSTVVTSETIGIKKPNPEIFYHAMKIAGCEPEDAIYVGDDYEVDVIGGCRAGMNTIYYNPEKFPNPLKVREIQSIAELKVLVE